VTRRRSPIQGNIELPRVHNYFTHTLASPSPTSALSSPLSPLFLALFDDSSPITPDTLHQTLDIDTAAATAIMSNYSQQHYGAPSRPAFSALQSSTTSTASYTSTSTSSLASRSSTQSAPPVSPSTSPQNHQYFGSLNQQSQQSQQQPRLQAQRHPSFEYQPSRSGAGQTAAETTNYLNQAALLAEAAKRAQMACVMRDLDGMEL
jgi:hypothetical protein